MSTEDVTDNVHLIARTRNEMQLAQASLGRWFAGKLDILAKERADIEENIAIARRNGWQVASMNRQLSRVVGRILFYEKCKVAVDAGYCIVPNFPVDVFAIRTEYDKARVDYSGTWKPADRDQTSEAPPLGVGEYRDSTPKVGSYTEQQPLRSDPSKLESIRYWFADKLQDIEFPVSIARPEIMNAAAESMALKCFDELGVLPNRRATKGDPILVGIVKDPFATREHQKQMMFLIAWYIDVNTL